MRFQLPQRQVYRRSSAEAIPKLHAAIEPTGFPYRRRRLQKERIAHKRTVHGEFLEVRQRREAFKRQRSIKDDDGLPMIEGVTGAPVCLPRLIRKLSDRGSIIAIIRHEEMRVSHIHLAAQAEDDVLRAIG